MTEILDGLVGGGYSESIFNSHGGRFVAFGNPVAL